MTEETRNHPLRASHQDVKAAQEIPDTAQTRAPAYRLAFTDYEFMCREELRPVRLQLELLKPQMIMDERGIESTIVVMGSARSREGGPMAEHYEEARRFSRLMTEKSLESYGQSIGLNIVLPHEQAPNAYITPDLCFNFHYFAVRKMHFLMRAKAICIFPGGFGTMDEMFEALTLIQTKRMKPVPFLLFGRAYWEKVVNWQAFADAGTISPDDLKLFRYVDTAEEAVAIIEAAQVN